jgi:hypothetical protein
MYRRMLVPSSGCFLSIHVFESARARHVKNVHSVQVMFFSISFSVIGGVHAETL